MLEEIKNMILLYDKVEDNILAKNNITNADELSVYLESSTLLDKIKFIHSMVASNLNLDLYKELLATNYRSILLLIMEINLSREKDPIKKELLIQELYNTVISE